MKKNLISIVILTLLIVNIVLTSIMMFSVVNTNKKTAALVTDVAAAISLELDAESTEENAAATVSMADIETYTIADMTIQMKPSVNEEDGTSEMHYMLTSVVLSMNTKNKDYKTYGADIANKEDLIKGEITEVIGQYTIDEASADTLAVTEAILSRIQSLYDSDFIFDVTLSNPLYQ